MVYNPNDPYDQLKWLAKVLLIAEQHNERVHLLHHVPSGRNECYRIWAREFRNIIDRLVLISNGFLLKNLTYIHSPVIDVR